MDHPSKLSRRCRRKHRASQPNTDAQKARCGVALVGKPEEVDAVASSIRKSRDECGTTPPGESRVEGKGELVKSGFASRASELTGERRRQG